jgi:magnesium transporter
MRLENYDAIYRQILVALGKGAHTLDLDSVTSIINELHPADIAEMLDDLTLPEALVVFNCVNDDNAAEALAKVSAETNRYLVENAPRERIVRLLQEMPMDDAAEIVSEIDEEDAAPLLAEIKGTEALEVKELLAYPEDTAGRLMTRRFAVVQPNTTVALSMEYLRQNADVLETVNVLYVTDGGGRLLGVCSIRTLLTARPNVPVRMVMTPEPITVTPETDQQEVARIIGQYDILSVPVVDASGRILGIVTIDDVIDVIVAEFSEDIAKMVGTDAEEMDRRTPVQVAKLRLPWLLGTLLIELGAGLVISRFDWVLREVILLASFMPVISASSGNVGLQAAAIIVRGLDTGHISMANWARAIRKELMTGFLMALVCGLVLGTVGAIWSRHLPFGLVVGGAMMCSMLMAGFMGTVIPMLSKRMGFDPATTAGPFETAFVDCIGFGVFLWLASLLIDFIK